MAKKKRIRYAQIILMISAILFVFAWENIQATKLGYKIGQIRQDIKTITNANNYLSKDIQIGLSPEKVQEKAVILGMVYPDPKNIIILEKKPDSDKNVLRWLAWAR